MKDQAKIKLPTMNSAIKEIHITEGHSPKRSKKAAIDELVGNDSAIRKELIKKAQNKEELL